MNHIQTPHPDPDRTRSFHSIFILDDHPVVHAGISALVSAEPDLAMAGEYERARGAVDIVLRTAPDVILLDLSLPDGSGYMLIKDLRAAGFDKPILVLSMHPENAFAERALMAGANGYVMKQNASETIIHAIREVLRGHAFLSPELTRDMVNRLASPPPREDAGVRGLTDREFEIFQFIAQGTPSRDIARQLSISPKTVEAHRAHMRAKLGLENGNQLVRYAIRWLEEQGHRS